METRLWDPFLTESDRRLNGYRGDRTKGLGSRPALLLVDLYRWVFGDRREGLFDAIKEWPGHCGLAGWDALPHIQQLLEHARSTGIPVIHVTGLDGVVGWRDSTPRGPLHTAANPDAVDRQRRRYDIMPEVAPREGEIVLRKTAPSAFCGTPLVALLTHLRIDTIIVAGESTSGCVRATVVDGRSYRFNMAVAEECVFDRHEASHAIALFDMDQKYADVLSLDALMRYVRDARSE
jgi:nicotinamidase-related amidase